MGRKHSAPSGTRSVPQPGARSSAAGGTAESSPASRRSNPPQSARKSARGSDEKSAAFRAGACAIASSRRGRAHRGQACECPPRTGQSSSCRRHCTRSGEAGQQRVRRNQPRGDQRRGECDEPAGVAARHGDVLPGDDGVPMLLGQFREAVRPAGGNAVRRRGIKNARIASFRQRDGFSCSSVRQAENGNVGGVNGFASGIGVLALFLRERQGENSPRSASRSKIRRPVVPSLPSIKTVHAMILLLHLCGIDA